MPVSNEEFCISDTSIGEPGGGVSRCGCISLCCSELGKARFESTNNPRVAWPSQLQAQDWYSEETALDLQVDLPLPLHKSCSGVAVFSSVAHVSRVTVMHLAD